MLGSVTVSPNELAPVIESIAANNNVDPDLIRAIIKQESNWDVNASRYEVKLGTSSWGLMQVLLTTAQSVMGDSSLSISQLVTPETNIIVGTKYIAALLARYSGDVRDAIAAYNAGTVKKNKDGTYVNQSYVDSVYRNYMMYRTIGSYASYVPTIPVENSTLGIGTILGIALVGLVIMES
jgi:soluble lytic murein transglycosylase-like protein